VEHGGSRERIQACIEANCDEDENDSCDDRCNSVGRQAIAECLRWGGDRATCLRHGQSAIQTCQRQNCQGR
jgi:hypothetical protein